MTFAPVFQRPFSATFDRRAAAASASWWLAGGAPTPVAVYQPKGAASLAASYTNLASPGTYDAAPGVAPTWATGTGWTLNGSSQYLTTGVIPANDQTWSAVVRYSGSLLTNRCVLGYVNTSGTVTRFDQYPNLSAGSVQYANGTVATTVAPALTTGVIGVAGRGCYRNGTSEATMAAGTGGTPLQIFVGARNLNGSPNDYLDGSIQAVAIYNNTLTAPQMAAISTAIAAL